MKPNKKILAATTVATILLAGVTYASFTGLLREVLDYARDGDADLDGMPTRWEIKHGLDPLRDERYEDPDRDGVFNIDEYALGSHPNNPDTDGDRVIDGEDRDPLARTHIPLARDFAPGLLSFTIPANVTLLACHAYSGSVLGGGLKDRGQSECLQSPAANEIQAWRLHERRDPRWKIDDVHGGAIHHRAGPAWWYNDTVGPTRYAVAYWPNIQVFHADVHNVRPVQLNDSEGRPFTYVRERFAIPPTPPRELTIEIQGYSPGHLPSFDVRFYATNDFEPGAEEDRRIVSALPLGRGAYRAHVPITNLHPGNHTLVLIPLVVKPDGAVQAPDEGFEVHSIDARFLAGSILQATPEPIKGLDEAPNGGVLFTIAADRLLGPGDSSIETLRGMSTFAAAVESFATLRLIPDASLHVDADVGRLSSSKLASTRTILITHEAGGGYVVTTHTQSLVRTEAGAKLVTRTTQAEYEALPKKYVQLAGEGIVKTTSHAVAVATQVAHDGLVVLKPVQGEADTLARASVKLQAGLSGTEAALSEVDSRALLARLALRGAVGGLAIFGIIHIAESWEAVQAAQGAEAKLRAWSGLAAGAVGLTTLVLPLAPVLVALGSLLAIVLEIAAHPELIPKIIDTASDAVQNAGGHIPEAIQRKLFIQAINDHMATARAKAAPIFFGQYDEAGRPIPPAHLQGSTSYNGAWGWLALLIGALMGAALVARGVTGRR